MTTRAVGAMASIDWLKQAVNLGRSNPRAIFGGAALLLLTMLAGAIAMSLLMVLGATALQADPTGSVAVSLVVGFAIVAMMAAMMVGYLRLVHAVEAGRPARATDVFAGFADIAASGRAIGFMLLLTIAQYVLIIGLVSIFAHDFGAWYIDNLKTSMSGQPAPPMETFPEGFWVAFVLMMAVGVVSYAVQAIGLGQIANGRGGIAAAFADGVSGAAKNLLPLLVLFLAMVLAAIALAIALGVLVMLVGLLGKLVGNWLLLLVGIPLYLIFLVSMTVVMFGLMYYVWRDICGSDRPVAPANAGEHGIEV